jgi:hypothetical protein
MSDTARSSRYEIRVEGVLDGLLNRVCDLGLVLISVRRLGPD